MSLLVKHSETFDHLIRPISNGHQRNQKGHHSFKDSNHNLHPIHTTTHTTHIITQNHIQQHKTSSQNHTQQHTTIILIYIHPFHLSLEQLLSFSACSRKKWGKIPQCSGQWLILNIFSTAYCTTCHDTFLSTPGLNTHLLIHHGSNHSLYSVMSAWLSLL